MSAPSISPLRGWLLLGGIGVCALGIGAATRTLNTDAKVVFVNGLDVPVTVTAGSAHFTIGANSHHRWQLPIGPLEVDVQGKQGRLAQETVFLTGEEGLFVYNVLGAAPLYKTTVTYTVSQSSSQSDATPVVLAGSSFRHVGRIDYMLTEPPARISMRKEDGRSTMRTHLGRAKGGWKSSYGWLMSLHRTADAARLAESIWKALPETPEVEYAANAAKLVAAREEGLLASLAAARAHRDANPEDMDVQRMWMHDMRRAGRIDDVRAHYQAAVEREPGSLLLGILLARLEPEPAGTQRLKALMRDHAGELLPRRALAVRHTRQQRWAEALPLLEAMEQGDPDYARYLSTHVETLVALGRRKEAARKLSEHLLQPKDEEDRLDLDDVRLYAKVVGHASQEGSANEVMRQLIESAQKDRPEGIVAVWLAASLGQRVDAEKLRAVPADYGLAGAARVLMALAEEPEFAARAAASVDFLGFRQLDTETGLLLAAEFERLGDAALAVKMLDVSNADLGYGELQDVLSGKLPIESLTTLDWGERAALHLVLARQLDARGQDSKAAYALVKKEVLLPGAVSIALQNWDRPKPSNAVAGDTVP
ncbi:hypothetical protein COCOR_06218 [Corallococcus coralloides DSM 2259]|uniref:Uncharacterized protein n=1 Tax=Corallococcus coralloides (strain ATCC 25202 / DSM 2259 / NBRC 100086 / M2) TaxID=1144275 RepID=H8MNT7_CORCM|nr:hypothetical protein [Corallococcus coralloides]AFE06816.1 hypothetical protein COCOR_06218 [Corallococcus coralloides DSM 2259]